MRAPERERVSPRPAGIDAETDARLQKMWKRAYSASDQDDLESLYADWVATYDDDHEKVGFFGHRVAAELLGRYLPFQRVAQVLDAGAGTGAAGVELARLGFERVTAMDLSQAMLDKASSKGVYVDAFAGDLGQPVDDFPGSYFDAAILVGVFSYGQAPAHALDEVVRLVKAGGVVVFTMRTDFFESDAMGVRSKMEELEQAHAWRQLELSDPMQYLPNKDPDALFRVWAFRVLDSKSPFVDEAFASAVRTAFASDGGPIKRIDHAFIWNSTASRLYDAYTEEPDYYLTDSEVSILARHGSEIVGEGRVVVELGCGSAHKIRHLLAVASASDRITYTPIDLSQGALEATKTDVEAEFGDRVEVDPRCAHYVDALATIPIERPKVLVWFGSSIGNIETLSDTVDFLRGLRERLGPSDRLVFGVDLDKDPDVLKRAYEAGPVNRSFFLNMIRRMNDELGANFDLNAFRQHSPYEDEPEWSGLRTKCVQLQLVSDRAQKVWFSQLHMEAEMEAGAAVQIGTSRKFRPDQIARVAELAGLKLTRQWFDESHWFSLNEVVLSDGGDGR